MLIRRATTAITTMMVAVVLAFAVPTAQLTTMSIVHTCCCPDPDHCHCPTPTDCGDNASMRSCHSHNEVTVSPTLASFVATAPVAREVVLTLAEPTTFVAAALIASPDPRRPSAPS